MGVDAGQQNTGSNNVFFGFESGLTNTGGDNVFLGYRSGKNATGSQKLYIDNSDTNTPLIYGEFNDNELTINGELGIGKNNPAYPIDLNSGARCTAAGLWVNASDASKKKDIESIPYGMAEVLQMQPKQYTYNIDGSASIGFIAQEMELIIPEVVSGEEGEKGIAYGLLSAVIVNGMQELANKNENLTTELQTQKDLVNQLMERLEKLEKTQK